MKILSDEAAEKLERTFSFVTGSHFINYHYGAILSKTLKVLPVWDFDANEIEPNLFLGDVYAAHNSKALLNHKITHIVTCTVGVVPPFPEHFKYMHLKILDFEGESIMDHFRETSKFISDALDEGGRVLVHCIRGVSRSATIVAAHLITRHKISHEEAVERVRAKRPIARPNYGFMTQLQQYSEKLKQGTMLQVTVSEGETGTGPDGAEVETVTETVTVTTENTTTTQVETVKVVETDREVTTEIVTETLTDTVTPEPTTETSEPAPVAPEPTPVTPEPTSVTPEPDVTAEPATVAVETSA